MKIKMVALCIATISAGSSAAFASVDSEYMMRVPTHNKLSFFSENKTEYTEWASVGQPHSCIAWTPDFSSIVNEISYLQNRSCSQQKEREKIDFKCDEFSKICTEVKRTTVQDSVDVNENRNVNSVLGEWSNSESPYNCSAWINDLDNSGDSNNLPQVRTCEQLQIASLEHFFESDSLFIGQSSQVIQVEENQVIPREKNSCNDLKQQDSRLSTGNYTLSNGQSVYCEMSIAGGGYQKVSGNLYSNGSFSGGEDSPNESGSNPTNTMTYMKNPTGSNYVIHQTGVTTSEYEVSPTSYSQLIDGRYIGLSLWTLEPGKRMFHNRMYFSGSSPVSDNGSSGIVEQKVVDGRTWYKVRYIAEITNSGMNEHNWYIGYGDSNFHFTGIELEVYSR